MRNFLAAEQVLDALHESENKVASGYSMDVVFSKFWEINWWCYQVKFTIKHFLGKTTCLDSDLFIESLGKTVLKHCSHGPL